MIHIDLMYISMISVLAPGFLGATLFKRLPYTLKILAIFIFVTCFLEGLVYVAWQFNENNMAVFHLFSYIEFGCISLIYYRILKSLRIVRFAILALGLLFVILSMYILFTWEYLTHFNSIQRGLEQIIILQYVVLFLILFSRRNSDERQVLRPYFVLSIGFLIYFSGMFLVFLDANDYLKFDKFFNWSIHSLLNIFLNVIYFVVLWFGGKASLKLSEKSPTDQ